MGGISYLLDTNILSEPARIKPNLSVMHNYNKFDGQYATASVVWHELQYVCALLQNSKRKTQLQSYLSMLLDSGLVILPYDQQAAEWFAQQRAALKNQGKMTTYADGEIAAIAAANNLTLVTRNTKDFEVYQNLVVDNWFKQ